MLSDYALGASGCSHLSPTHLHGSTLVSHSSPICPPFVSHLPLTVSEYAVGAPAAWFYTFVACDGCDIGIDMARESKPGKNEIKNEIKTRCKRDPGQYNVEVWTYKNSVIRKQLHQTQFPPPERNIYDIRPEHKWIPKPNLNARKTQKHSKPWSRWDHQSSPAFGKKARLPGKASPQLNIAISLKKARLCLLAVVCCTGCFFCNHWIKIGQTVQLSASLGWGRAKWSWDCFRALHELLGEVAIEGGGHWFEGQLCGFFSSMQIQGEDGHPSRFVLSAVLSVAQWHWDLGSSIVDLILLLFWLEVVDTPLVVDFIQGNQRPRAKAAKWVGAVASGLTSRKVYLGLHWFFLLNVMWGLMRINVTGVVCCKCIISTTWFIGICCLGQVDRQPSELETNLHWHHQEPCSSHQVSWLFSLEKPF